MRSRRASAGSGRRVHETLLEDNDGPVVWRTPRL